MNIGNVYLRNRIGGQVPACADIRFHDACPRGDERHPAIIALMRDVVTNEPRAIQRIFLRPDGSDRLRDHAGKMTLGPARGAVVKLSPDDVVTTGLGICEGIEKGLALLSAGWAPIWATCGTATMQSFPVLAGIEALTIFADNDDAGQKAATACALRWANADKEVIIQTPASTDEDWSDVILREAA